MKRSEIRERPHRYSAWRIGCSRISLRSMRATSRKKSIPRELAQLRADLGRPLDHRVPCDLVGAIHEFLRRLRPEVERLDAALGLALDFRLVGRDVLGIQRFEPQRGVDQDLALWFAQALPHVEIHQHVHLDAVEARLHAVFGDLVPAEVEDPAHRPAVAVDHAALERRIDLARRRVDRRAAQRLDDVAIDRGHPDLQAGEVDRVDLLVEIDVERHVVELARQVPGIELVIVQLVDVVPGAVAPLLAHRLAEQLEGVGFGDQVAVERAGDVGHVDDARAYGVAHLERRQGARAADIVDLDDALAVAVHLLDEAFEILGELGSLREGGDGPQGDLVGRGDWLRQHGCEHGCGGKTHDAHDFPLYGPGFRRLSAFAYSCRYVRTSQFPPFPTRTGLPGGWNETDALHHDHGRRAGVGGCPRRAGRRPGGREEEPDARGRGQGPALLSAADAGRAARLLQG